ncbi:DUF3823 domain-containing protein [Bacteroides sp. 51]|uniref:DUF3823 domain-containing protein n=1 Tax=Bacteroides sp. 51 TaxID=2302938 RepID=UPI0013D637DD|nr:DUF3823 domain-containing protein [Bacteroides sp. 51]NDV81771.1 DUF3823 domain-containing protein [Bacteroides sp. 51]
MKKITAILASLAFVVGLTSCEKDNYDAPAAGIAGQITDHNGQPFQTAQSKGSMEMRVVETSFTNGDESIVVLPQGLNMLQDGSYVNQKLFAGTYDVTPWQGAFYPDVETKSVELKNGKTTTVDFTVTPYLSLEWVKEPYMTADGFLKASFKFKRNEKAGQNKPDLQDACMWISRTQYCGTEGDPNYTPGNLTLTAAMEGQEIELTSKLAIKYSMKYWVRIGARCKDTYQKYNFTDIKTIDVKVN